VPIETGSLRPDLVVADVIPNPPQTQLLTAAAAAGCPTIDGLGMLVGQGVLGVGFWTGDDLTPANSPELVAVMRAALEEVLG